MPAVVEQRSDDRNRYHRRDRPNQQHAGCGQCERYRHVRPCRGAGVDRAGTEHHSDPPGDHRPHHASADEGQQRHDRPTVVPERRDNSHHHAASRRHNGEPAVDAELPPSLSASDGHTGRGDLALKLRSEQRPDHTSCNTEHDGTDQGFEH